MASVGVGLASGRCTSVQLDTNVGAGEWPNKLPALLYDRTYAATRTEALPSRFGDLGGVWRASPEGASEGCTIRVEGNKLSADCTANIFAGKTELTIGDDCVASGVNNGGYEISGRKR